MAAHEQFVRLDTTAAEELLESFLPMFAWLEDHNIEYCLVGGLAVLLHGFNAKEEAFRATIDADVMFDASFTNADFAHAYLDVYASDPAYSQCIYDAVFGKGIFDELSSEAQSLVNASFIGAEKDLDGVETPDFDVVRSLNGFNLKSIEREAITFHGKVIQVATVEQLLAMKERTIALLHADISTTSRPQDFIDRQRLSALVQQLKQARHE
jgi:hypothetical protein